MTVAAPSPTSTAHTAPYTNFSDREETPAHRKLRQAAQEFEGMLISQLLQDFHFTSLGGESPGSDTLNSLAVETLSNSMAARGGFGIAQMLVHQLDPSLDRGQHSQSSTALR